MREGLQTIPKAYFPSGARHRIHGCSWAGVPRRTGHRGRNAVPRAEVAPWARHRCGGSGRAVETRGADHTRVRRLVVPCNANRARCGSLKGRLAQVCIARCARHGACLGPKRSWWARWARVVDCDVGRGVEQGGRQPLPVRAVPHAVLEAQGVVHKGSVGPVDVPIAVHNSVGQIHGDEVRHQRLRWIAELSPHGPPWMRSDLEEMKPNDIAPLDVGILRLVVVCIAVVSHGVVSPKGELIRRPHGRGCRLIRAGGTRGAGSVQRVFEHAGAAPPRHARHAACAGGVPRRGVQHGVGARHRLARCRHHGAPLPGGARGAVRQPGRGVVRARWALQGRWIISHGHVAASRGRHAGIADGVRARQTRPHAGGGLGDGHVPWGAHGARARPLQRIGVGGTVAAGGALDPRKGPGAAWEARAIARGAAGGVGVAGVWIVRPRLTAHAEIHGVVVSAFKRVMPVELPLRTDLGIIQVATPVWERIRHGAGQKPFRQASPHAKRILTALGARFHPALLAKRGGAAGDTASIVVGAVRARRTREARAGPRNAGIAKSTRQAHRVHPGHAICSRWARDAR